MKNARFVILFLLAALVLAGILRLASALPSIFDSGTTRRYASLEAALDITKLHGAAFPSFFPDHLLWPPSEIFAGTRPEPSLLVHVADKNTGEYHLAISQAWGVPPLPSRIEPRRAIHVSRQDINGTISELTLGVCENQETCNRLRWKAGPLSYEISGRLPEAELLRIARSMVPFQTR